MSTLAMEVMAKADWLDWRKGGIGASEAAAAIGVSPYETPFELYSRKVGDLPPIVENEAMELGLLMEPVIATLYQRRTGVEIVRTQVRAESRQHPFLRATIDGMTKDGYPVEFKTAGSRSADQWGESGSDVIPLNYLAQVHHQLIVTGAELADVAVLLGGNEFRVYTVEADPDLHESMIAKLAEFWGRVQDRRPPDPTDRDWATIAKLRPRIAATIDLDEEAGRLATVYGRIGESIKELENERAMFKAQLILAMGEHAVASLPDGRAIFRKVVDRKAHEVKASSYVDFRVKQIKGE